MGVPPALTAPMKHSQRRENTAEKIKRIKQLLETRVKPKRKALV